MGGNAKPLAGKAKVFFRGSFHAHIVQSKAQSIGNVLPHGRDMRCQLGCLTQNSGVNVANSITGFIQQTANLPQQHQGICSLVPRVGIRKMLADIPQRRRAKQCIRNCVQQHICIGMAQQAFFIWDRHAAHNQLAALHQAVNIITMTNAHCIFSLILCRGGQVLFRGNFQVDVIALRQVHRQARQFKQAAVIGHQVDFFPLHSFQSLPVQVPAEALGRLHRKQSGAVRCLHYSAVIGDLDGILDRNRRGSGPHGLGFR